MKKIVAMILAAGLFTTMTANAYYFSEAEQKEISITVNGKKLELDQPPVIENDRTLVPVRAISEALGAEVYFNYIEEVDVLAAVETLKGDRERGKIAIVEIRRNNIGMYFTVGNNSDTVSEVYYNDEGEIIGGGIFIPKGPIYSNEDMSVFKGVFPQIINGRTMVPVRAISEFFNATVEWDEKTNTVTIWDDYI